jgi:lipoprotein-anchoring transpeptidase ErfK/SrfK
LIESRRTRGAAPLAMFLAMLAACAPGDRDRERVEPATDPRAGTAGTDTLERADRDPRELSLEISISARELYVYRDGERSETHPVAVGQDEYPTPTGDYRIDRVIWNPEWVPPDSEWAADREDKAPGDPDNPLGPAQIVFDMPYSIHGTNQPESLGRAASHGSVRVSNEVVTELARKLMEAGGEIRPDEWYRDTRRNPTEMREVTLRDPVPLTIRD